MCLLGSAFEDVHDKRDGGIEDVGIGLVGSSIKQPLGLLLLTTW